MADGASEHRRLRDRLQQVATRIEWDVPSDLDVDALLRRCGRGGDEDSASADRTAAHARARRVLAGLTGTVSLGHSPDETAEDWGFIDWLVDPHDRSASELWETLQLLRDLRRQVRPKSAEGD